MLAALLLTLIAAIDAAATAGAPTPTVSWAQDALTRALAASEDIADSFHRSQTLAEISEAQSAAGDVNGARASLAKAKSIADGITEDALRSWALHDIALAYIKADDLAAAESIGDSIRDSRLHDVVLASVVDARRGVRDVTAAQTAARHMRDAARQGQSLRSIAILQASQNDFTAAIVTARSIQHGDVNALAISDIAAAIAREGSFEEARSLVTGIRNGQGRARGLVEVAVAQASRGDVKGALAMVEQVDDKFLRAEGLARVAAQRASAEPEMSRELFAQSMALVSGVRGSVGRRCDTLIEIARAQVIGGDVAGSSATLKRVFDDLRNVKNETDRLNFVSRIAPIQARAGDYAGAMATAMRADDGSLRPLLVRDVAVTQAESGDVAGAVAAARALDDRAAAAAALFGIMRVQSDAHDLAGLRETIAVALQTIRFIGNAEMRAGALGSLAATRVQEGDISAAQALFTEALTAALTLDSGREKAAVYARIADSLVDRHRVIAD